MDSCIDFGTHRAVGCHPCGKAAHQLSLWPEVTAHHRQVADQGREARHPFLDEALMDLLLGLPLHCIADLRQAPGAVAGAFDGSVDRLVGGLQ